MISSNTLMAQTRLRQTREEFRELMLEASSEQFPRSMIMKYLLSANGQRAMGDMAGQVVSRFSPVVGGLLRFIGVRILLDRLWTRMGRA